VEASFLIHATEDEEKTTRAVRELLGAEEGPERQELEGHFGNKIVSMRFHLTGDEAEEGFKHLLSRLGKDGRDELRRDLADLVDEHGALFFRLSKQFAVHGSAALSGSDPIRVKVKPRAYLVKGEPSEFYARMMEGA
jgi:RNA binding exosome subunit